MKNKKSNTLRNIILILTIVFFVAGVILVGIQVKDYYIEKPTSNDKIDSAELSSGGIVSINIVEAPENLEEVI